MLWQIHLGKLVRSDTDGLAFLLWAGSHQPSFHTCNFMSYDPSGASCLMDQKIPPISHTITRAPSSVRVQFQLLVYPSTALIELTCWFYSAPCVCYQLIQNPKEGLLIRLSDPQTEKSPLSSSGKQRRNFSPLKAYFQCSNFLWLFCICETRQVKPLIHSFNSAYIKPCTRFYFYRGFTNGLQRPMNLSDAEAYAIFS